MGDNLLQTMYRHQWNVTFSIGAVTFIKPPNCVEEMIQKADRLMYLVKTNGKNKIKHKAEMKKERVFVFLFSQND
jgi:PleD family two-component response regulator